MHLGSLQPLKHPLDDVHVRGVAQPGSASVLGTEGRRFESFRPDHILSSYKTGRANLILSAWFLLSITYLDNVLNSFP